jgi:hypothetical protein
VALEVCRYLGEVYSQSLKKSKYENGIPCQSTNPLLNSGIKFYCRCLIFSERSITTRKVFLLLKQFFKKNSYFSLFLRGARINLGIQTPPNHQLYLAHATFNRCPRLIFRKSRPKCICARFKQLHYAAMQDERYATTALPKQLSLRAERFLRPCLL